MNELEKLSQENEDLRREFDNIKNHVEHQKEGNVNKPIKQNYIP